MIDGLIYRSPRKMINCHHGLQQNLPQRQILSTTFTVRTKAKRFVELSTKATSGFIKSIARGL
jgi:hypothetical protein